MDDERSPLCSADILPVPALLVLIQLFNILAQSAVGPEVYTEAVTVNNADTDVTGTCDARVKIDNDGYVYSGDEDGAYGAALYQWLVSGSNTEVWVSRTYTGDAPTIDDIGTGRRACSLDSVFSILQSGSGTKASNPTFTFWDAASGGSNLGSFTADLDATVF